MNDTQRWIKFNRLIDDILRLLLIKYKPTP